jgi:Cu2+-exporting ATPase
MATPLVLNVAIGKAAHHGILVRSGDALLALATKGTIYLDKTGTLTEGHMAVSWWDGDESAQSIVLGLEQGAAHPVADAFRRALPEIAPALVTGARRNSGKGISGSIAGQQMHVGSRTFVESILGHPISPSRTVPDHMTPVFLTDGERVIASAGLTDPVRYDARMSVRALRLRGWHVSMLTGDAKGPAMAVGQETDIPAADMFWLASPDDKLVAVHHAKERGTVVVVGDGVNDAAALSASSAGIAMHGGAEVALRCADAYFTRPGLAPLVMLVDAARRTQSTIHALLIVSVTYNLAAVALAFSGHISPLIAAILMPISSVTVIAGAWHANPFRARS